MLVRSSFLIKQTHILLTNKQTHMQLKDKQTHILLTDTQTHMQLTDKQTHILLTDTQTRMQLTDKQTHMQETDKQAHMQFTDTQTHTINRHIQFTKTCSYQTNSLQKNIHKQLSDPTWINRQKIHTELTDKQT